ncbi:hypothetical protein G9A89_010634 [Geosiphon pyriformis]|nr:hypothetical protein G9A89_010634 [Geosiphon pyriformis]
MPEPLDMSLDDIINRKQGPRAGRRRRGDLTRTYCGRISRYIGSESRISDEILKNETKIFVSNLAFNVTEGDLYELFSTMVGPVCEITLDYDQQGQFKGTATVTFVRRGEAFKAIERFRGMTLDGNELKIEIIMTPRSNPISHRIGGIDQPSLGRGRGFRGSFRGLRRGGRRGRGEDRRQISRTIPTQQELDAEIDAYMETEGLHEQIASTPPNDYFSFQNSDNLGTSGKTAIIISDNEIEERIDVRNIEKNFSRQPDDRILGQRYRNGAVQFKVHNRGASRDEWVDKDFLWYFKLKEAEKDKVLLKSPECIIQTSGKTLKDHLRYFKLSKAEGLLEYLNPKKVVYVGNSNEECFEINGRAETELFARNLNEEYNNFFSEQLPIEQILGIRYDFYGSGDLIFPVQRTNEEILDMTRHEANTKFPEKVICQTNSSALIGSHLKFPFLSMCSNRFLNFMKIT